ncbi:VOC family protein [Brevundimonas sp. BT-123]|uniref:2-oxoadipate dioxygenase/decarboxylase HglS n=1 Tax=Brevundimonas sp. BT-123 TaxID=2986928 RepID=UPI002236B594|nr:VOC family protein [Brevundimonas sp. BT-123]MCW0047784.1 VOC family protein [Brevundimonas sp. BT-123]
MSAFVHPDEIRSRFSAALSAMYRAEVPQYGDLLTLVADINAQVLKADAGGADRLAASGELARLSEERHGAIRVGTADELATIARAFAVMGMEPVSYYNLAPAGVPVHSTAFRPVDPAALARNPFRVFTSLLRLELIEDEALRAEAAATLARRDIFTPGARELIETAQAAGGLDEAQADRFVSELLETFRWHAQATVSAETYERLVAAHRLIADVVSFKGPHINHLTPRTLNIDAAQAAMPARGISPKETIEGPPARACPILLRQTSFKALQEAITFPGADGPTAGAHTARFGEIEQRGCALTPAGRALYDEALAKKDFSALPDDWDALRRADLAWFRYRPTPEGLAGRAETADLEALISSGHVVAEPITYEDFLPVSAAGIFQSNLGSEARETAYAVDPAKADFEQALGRPVQYEMALYRAEQDTSITATLKALGLTETV